jgi:spore coat polysaccharide biosynthesis predicted glycosyltransferase SpsG
LGLDYFLPHPTLKNARKAFNPTPEKLLILIGSGDPTHLVTKLIEALNSVEYCFKIRVLTANSIKVHTKHQLEIYPLQRNINLFYQWADMLITSGGLAKYEAAFVHKPAVVFSQTVGEQAETLDFAKAALCFDFGRAQAFDGTVFADNFTRLLHDVKTRRLAYKHSQKMFKEDSAGRAAQFVQTCLTRPGC